MHFNLVAFPLSILTAPLTSEGRFIGSDTQINAV